MACLLPLGALDVESRKLAVFMIMSRRLHAVFPQFAQNKYVGGTLCDVSSMHMKVIRPHTTK